MFRNDDNVLLLQETFQFFRTQQVSAERSSAGCRHVAVVHADDGQETASGAGQETASPTLVADEGQEAAQPATEKDKLANADVKVRAKVFGGGWKAAVKSGRTAGTMSKKGLRALKMSLDGLGGVSGSIRYRVYSPGRGWTATSRDGKAASSGKKPVGAVRIWLAGKVSKYYDVRYRVLIKGYGWLDWASDKQVAGTTKLSYPISAVQVKLVKKGAKFKGKAKTPRLENRWQALEFKYRDDEEVRHLLEVKYTGGTRARVVLRKKKGTTWKTQLSCQGYVGSRGIGRAHEGVARTPSGDFGITSAFGIRSDPGSILPYVKVTDDMYWCADEHYYNQLIDINECPHDCAGEHLASIAPYYNYGLFFDYNTNPVRLHAGSAFFVHCKAGEPYTGGCIAVSQANMIKIVRTVTPGARLLIYRK